MLFVRGFVDFICEDVLFPDIKWVYFSVKSCKDNVFQVVLAVWNAFLFITLKFWSLNQFDRAFNPEIPEPDGIVLAWGIKKIIIDGRNGDKVLGMD